MSERPKYQSISIDLRERIARTEFATGEQLPSQHALAEEYGVTVMTLRQALADLESDGLVRAAKGKGTFVSEPPSVHYGLDHLRSFTQEMTEQGLEVRTDVLAIDHDPAGAGAVRDALGLGTDAPIVELTRRRSSGPERLVVQRSSLSTELWERLDDADLAQDSLYDALAERCGVVLERASESIRAVNLGAADADLLGVPGGSAALESTRVSYSVDGSAFLFDRAILRGTEIRTERTAAGANVEFQAV